MKRLIFICALLFGAPVAAQTQVQMNARATAEWKAADARMTVEWRRTYASMKRRDAADTSRGGGFGYAAALLASQRAWLAFRDTECVIEGGRFAGGSAQGMATGQCKTRLSRERTQQLKAMIWK